MTIQMDGRRKRGLVQQSFHFQGADGLGAKVASGAAYQMLGIMLRTALTIGSTAVLARLLLPADFGYLAMAAVVTEFAGLFGSFGFTNVLIQRKRITRSQLDTVFWATLAMGIALMLLVFVLSFFSGALFADPKVGDLLRVLCLNFPLTSLTAVSWVVLSRQFKFRSQFAITTGAVAIRSAGAVALALAGFGVWSLVLGSLLGSISTVLLSWVLVPYLPRLRAHWHFLRATWRTSGGYFGNTVMYYINMNLDLMMLGRMLGPTPLGYYQNARSLTDEIRARIAMPIQHVLFPAFSSVQSDRQQFHRLVLRATRMLAAIVVPIGVGVSANATELVKVLYGNQWLPMIPVMAMFGLSAAIRAATATASPLFNSMNRVGLALRYNTVGTVLMIGGILIAMPHGIHMVAVAMALTSLYALVTFRAAFVLVGLTTTDSVMVLLRPALAAALMWCATEAFRLFVFQGSPVLMLALQVLLGALVYLLALHMMSRQYVEDFGGAFTMMVKRSPVKERA
jgi:O-antigen/teichoic acid export membrane protein